MATPNWLERAVKAASVRLYKHILTHIVRHSIQSDLFPKFHQLLHHLQTSYSCWLHILSSIELLDLRWGTKHLQWYCQKSSSGRSILKSTGNCHLGKSLDHSFDTEEYYQPEWWDIYAGDIGWRRALGTIEGWIRVILAIGATFAVDSQFATPCINLDPKRLRRGSEEDVCLVLLLENSSRQSKCLEGMNWGD